MNISEIRDILDTKDYDFIKNEDCLNNKIILLGLGGSYAYGTNNENSDIDIRGIALNSKKELLTFPTFEQYVDETTDTVIYSFRKIISLLLKCNPNTIEMLGLKPEHYLYVSPVGQELLDNKKLFLSKKAVHSFGGYANQQLYRLQQKSASQMKQADLEEYGIKVRKAQERNGT